MFVAASVTTMVLNEIRRQPRRATPGRVQTSASDPAPKLIAYYLHGKVRCVTCNDIERTAKEAIEEGFGAELRSGRLEWRVVNYDEPGNEHYATDFKIAAPCVVLASMSDGRQVAWKSLPEVWELIDDKPAFRGFVQKNVRQQLDLGPPVSNSPAAGGTHLATRRTLEVAATAKLPRLLDLGAGKCIPCKKMAPVLENLQQEYRGPARRRVPRRLGRFRCRLRNTAYRRSRLRSSSIPKDGSCSATRVSSPGKKSSPSGRS